MSELAGIRTYDHNGIAIVSTDVAQPPVVRHQLLHDAMKKRKESLGQLRKLFLTD